LLSSGHDLIVRLESPFETDFTAYSVSTTGAKNHPQSPFDANGVALVPGCPSGSITVNVHDPEGGQVALSDFFDEGAEWSVAFPLHVGTDLTLELQADEHVRPQACQVSATCALRDGRRVTRDYLFAADEPAHLGLVPGDAVALILQSGDGTVLARHGFALNGGVQVETVRLDATSLTLRLVDGNGEPVRSATAWISSPKQSTSSESSTDWEGRATFEGVVGDPLRLSVMTSRGGFHGDLEVRRSRGDEEQVVVVDTTSAVAVKLVDGDEPVSGVKLWLMDPLHGSILSAQWPDSHGVARWSDLGKGTYRLIGHVPGRWRIDTSVRAQSPNAPPVEVPFRRVGELRVFAHDVAGKPMPGVEISLHSAELDESVATWIADGRATSSTGSLHTASDGVLVLAGLPAGTYSWSSAASPSKQGSVSVVGSDRVDLDVPVASN
jgi:hypothetical protein